MILLDVSEFSPDAEDTRSNMLLAQLFYQFALGVGSRDSVEDGSGINGSAIHIGDELHSGSNNNSNHYLVQNSTLSSADQQQLQQQYLRHPANSLSSSSVEQVNTQASVFAHC